jgi:hypothetical protein
MPEQVIQREDRAAIFLSRALQTAHDSPSGQVSGRLPSIPLPSVDLIPLRNARGGSIAAEAP